MLSGCSHHLSNEDAVRIYGLLRQGTPPSAVTIQGF